MFQLRRVVTGLSTSFDSLTAVVIFVSIQCPQQISRSLLARLGLLLNKSSVQWRSRRIPFPDFFVRHVFLTVNVISAPNCLSVIA